MAPNQNFDNSMFLVTYRMWLRIYDHGFEVRQTFDTFVRPSLVNVVFLPQFINIKNKKGLRLTSLKLNDSI